jgi:hypothetical protein
VFQFINPTLKPIDLPQMSALLLIKIIERTEIG